MNIGTYYYPEQWPKEQWSRDFDAIASMGLRIVHMAEFAWFALEPEPGLFQFEWLHECVEMARQRGLEVILCTPTASPPIWLVERHPEVLPCDENGRLQRFGGRRHYTPTAPALWRATERIVRKLAEEFHGHPSLIGWQIDNEYSGAFDQSPATHRAFREWLAAKYGTIDALNEAWGCQFWSTQYTDFAQIRMPPSRDPNYANPHQCLDGARFWSSAFARFNAMQAAILREAGVSREWITTNFMPFHPDANPLDMADDLTLFSWDSYPVGGFEVNPKDQTFRIGDPRGIGFVHDQMASYTGRWALMEMQPGQVNWGKTAPMLAPGVVRLWLWTAFAHGAEFVTTYRFRQPRFGVEMWHHGLMNHDGITPSPAGRQFMQTIDEIKRLDLSRVPERSQEPEESLGILLDFDQIWWSTTLPQTARWSYQGWLLQWYGAAQKLGLPVRVLHPGRAWGEGLKYVIAPGLQIIGDATLEAMRAFVGRGGHLLLTCRTALQDETGQFFEGPTAMPIVDLIGATIESYDALPREMMAKVNMDGQAYDWGVWADHLMPQEGTQVLATYADQFYAGRAACTQKQHGPGTVTYCGVAAEQPLIDALLSRVTGLNQRLPDRLVVRRRGPYQIALNYGDQPVEAPAPVDARFMVGERRIPPAGVAVWTSA